MTSIGPQLERLGLEQYHAALAAEGFDTWETLLDIQESDLDALNVKLGHRRKLQRAIAEFRGFSSDRPLGSPSQEGPADNAKSGETGIQSAQGKEVVASQPPETKRKYRRHPKPDDNAPEKPPSAYVIFSNRIREEVKGDNLTFTEIARLVGERWQKLDTGEKEPFETQAAAMKETYQTQLAEYKKTDAYKDYLQYLADFKAKHGQVTESKRPKLDLQYSSSTSGVGQDAETSTQGSGHKRGGSMGSMSNASHGGPLLSPAGMALTPVSSLPNLNISGSRHLHAGGRGSPPPLAQYAHDPRFPGQLSSQSSVSEESGATRLEQFDALSRTATLSLSTPPAMTPPLPSSASISGRSEQGSTSEITAWAQRHPHGVPPTTGLSASPSSRTYIPPASSTGGETWRDRPNEQSRHPFHQSGSLPISSLLGTEHGLELSHAQAQRTLPPLRRPPSGPGAAPPILHSFSSSSRESLEPSPNPSGQGRASLNRSESEAASTLAGLAKHDSMQESVTPAEKRMGRK